MAKTKGSTGSRSNTGARSNSSTSTRRKRRIRDIPGNFIARNAWMRKRYARRLVKMFKKSREKGRHLSGNLAIIERQLRPLPPAVQMQKLEEILAMGSETQNAPISREMRRATERADRQGTRGKGVRPGLAPGQRRRSPGPGPS